MFSEKLIIPNSLEDGNTAPVKPILESARFDAIRMHYEHSTRAYDDKVEAAYAVAGLLREELTFSDHTKHQPELSPEWVARGHTTNCYGHSIITSECLDELGIDHRVGFANQHGFLLMEDADSGMVNLIDTPVEKLCIDITPALGGVALNCYTGKLGGVNYMWGDVILRRSHFGNKERALTRRPWLTFTANKDQPSFWDKEANDYANRLILRTYTPQQGREVLLSYDNFVHAISRRDTRKAHGWLAGLDGTYPDIDKRNRLTAPTRLVQGLGEKAMVGDALRDIEIIENSLAPFTNDVILRLWPADRHRGLGVQLRSGVLIQQAIDKYDKLYESRRENGDTTQEIESRIRKAKSQLQRITG